MAEPRRDSLTYSITRNRDGSFAEDQFRYTLKVAGSSWMTVLKEMGPLTSNGAFRPATVDIYVSTGQNDAADSLGINIAFQNFASTLRPHKVSLHLIPISRVETDILINELRNPNRHNPIVWEERLANG